MMAAEDFGFLSRDELLGGLPARRASTLLFAIESRTAHLVVRARQAAARYLTERTAAEQERAFLDALAQGRDLPVRLRIQDLERYAPEWAALVPTDAGIRAALARLLADKYAFTRGNVPGLRLALGLDDGAVGQTFERLHGRPLGTIYAARTTQRERLRWAWSRLARRLENLPPFWTVFALTFTETVGAGILALPIALAGVGPLAGVVLLVVLGLVNVLTIAALSEAFTRNGSVRYGQAYFGRVAADYLGRASALALAPGLLVFLAFVLLAYTLGLASTLASASGVRAEVWVALLFLINLAFLRRGSLDATIASALVVGAVNVGLIVLLSLLALPHVRAENLFYLRVPFVGGSSFDPSLLGLIFGVILTAYFGHFSTGTCARLVLSRDPSGRSLLRGNVAAMAVAVALYSFWVIVVNGALSPAALAAQSGTALTPLAAEVGPLVYVFGVIFVILAMGMASVHCSVALYRQACEWLPAATGPHAAPSPPGTGLSSWGRRMASKSAVRFWLGVAPVVLIFALGEVLLLTRQDSFTAPLGFLGALVVPILAGVFPVLMLAASRRKGEYVPGTVLRLLGHPIVLVGIYLLFVGGILLHGLLIWQQPLERLAALLVGIATIGLTAVVLGRGALTPRAVVELRVDADEPRQATFSVTANGKAAVADVRLHYAGRDQHVVVAPGEACAFANLHSATFELPPTAARQLKVRVHQISPDASSAGVPALLAVRAGGAGQAIHLELPDGQVVLPMSGEAQHLEIILTNGKGQR